VNQNLVDGSATTTSVIGALKRSLTPQSGELGIHVCGGRSEAVQRAERWTAEPDVISERRELVVLWRLRYKLSLRDLAETRVLIKGPDQMRPARESQGAGLVGGDLAITASSKAVAVRYEDFSGSVTELFDLRGM
jgi:hypothetical protein